MDVHSQIRVIGSVLKKWLLWKGESCPSVGCKYSVWRSTAICSEVRLKQWFWLKGYGSFFILKNLLEDLQVVTSFALSSSFGSTGFRAQRSSSTSSCNAAASSVANTLCRETICHLVLKIHSMKAGPLDINKLDMNLRGKMMTLPQKNVPRASKSLRAFERNLRDTWGCA